MPHLCPGSTREGPDTCRLPSGHRGTHLPFPYADRVPLTEPLPAQRPETAPAGLVTELLGALVGCPACAGAGYHRLAAWFGEPGTTACPTCAGTGLVAA